MMWAKQLNWITHHIDHSNEYMLAKAAVKIELNAHCAVASHLAHAKILWFEPRGK